MTRLFSHEEFARVRQELRVVMRAQGYSRSFTRDTVWRMSMHVQIKQQALVHFIAQYWEV